MMKGKKEKLVRKKLVLPEIIKDDLTYYMQFGWKQTHHRGSIVRDEKKYAGTVYRDRYINEGY